MTTGERIARRRREMKMSQEQLAERADISVREIVLIEHGRRSPTIEELLRIAHGLESDVHALIEPGVQRPKPAKKGKKKSA